MKTKLIVTITLTSCFSMATMAFSVNGIRSEQDTIHKQDTVHKPLSNPLSQPTTTGNQQSDPNKPNPSSAGGSGKPNTSPNRSKTSFVIDVMTMRYLDSNKVENAGTNKTAKGEDWIWIVVSNPMTFMANRPSDKKKIVLYANGIELKDFKSELFANVTKDNYNTTDTTIKVSFFLKRDSSTKRSWDNLYRLAGNWYKNQTKVSLSVGWEDMLPLEISPKDSTKVDVTLTLFSNYVFIWMIVSYLALLIGLGTLVLTTDILKEGVVGAYSLAQTQLAFWTILILSGFIYSLLITGIPSTLNTSILTLLGISMGTNGVAKYIDYFNKISKEPTLPKLPTGSFWRDILGDGDSINMQRFQIVAWNIILGGYFTFFTFHNKTMPIIPDVLLTLAGMSSLTYVVAKPTETKPTETKPVVD